MPGTGKGLAPAIDSQSQIGFGFYSLIRIAMLSVRFLPNGVKVNLVRFRPEVDISIHRKACTAILNFGGY